MSRRRNNQGPVTGQESLDDLMGGMFDDTGYDPNRDPLATATTQPPSSGDPATKVVRLTTEPKPARRSRKPEPAATPATTPASAPAGRTGRPPTPFDSPDTTPAPARRRRRPKKLRPLEDVTTASIIGRRVLPIIVIVVVIVGFAATLRATLFDGHTVADTTMTPTLDSGDRVIVEKARGAYRRGELVLITTDTGPIITRVVAVAGERISLLDGKVEVNNLPLPEYYLPDGVATTGLIPATVPAGEVYVLGDNRAAATDSRTLGPIPIDTIRGRVVLRVWPHPGTL